MATTRVCRISVLAHVKCARAAEAHTVPVASNGNMDRRFGLCLLMVVIKSRKAL